MKGLNLSFPIFILLFISGLAFFIKGVFVSNLFYMILGFILLVAWCALIFIGIALAQDTKIDLGDLQDIIDEQLHFKDLNDKLTNKKL